MSWRVLSVSYALIDGVQDQIVQLLADLHTGAQAGVRLGGQVGDWFTSTVG